jgi:hypothetical protein
LEPLILIFIISDDIVSRTLEAAKSSYNQVLAVYTGYHSSWTPGESNIRNVRSLLQIEEPHNGSRFINAEDQAFLYYTSAPVLAVGNTEPFVPSQKIGHLKTKFTFCRIQLVNFLEATVTPESEEGAPLTMNVVYSHEDVNITIM